MKHALRCKITRSKFRRHAPSKWMKRVKNKLDKTVFSEATVLKKDFPTESTDEYHPKKPKIANDIKDDNEILMNNLESAFGVCSGKTLVPKISRLLFCEQLWIFSYFCINDLICGDFRCIKQSMLQTFCK